MAATARFKLPSTIASPADPQQSADTPFKINDFLGQWYLVRTSNTFWKDKRNVRMEHTESGHDRFFYQAVKSDGGGRGRGGIKTMEGRNTPVPDAVSTFSWQGKGLLRLFGATWEILGYNEMGEAGRSWMITFQHKTMFTSPAVNVACRSPDGFNDADRQQVEDWLIGLGEETFTTAVQGIYTIAQE